MHHTLRLFIGLSFFLSTAILSAQPLNIDSVSNFKFSGSIYPNTNEVWGHVDTSGNEYALVGRENGFSVISLADPSNPQLVYSDTSSASLWRDLKSWKGYAYVVNESSGGLEIYDLNALPDSVRKVGAFVGSNFPLIRAHNLYIDSSGVAYIFGSNNQLPNSSGTIFLDVDTDPESPIELGNYDSLYLHDGYVRDDTLYGSAVFDGTLLIIDVSDKQNPVLLGSVSTPSSFTHNVWLSDDGNTAFTTDEVSGAFITAYDVTDPSRITELDRIRTRDRTNIIPHNTHVFNDFLVTSYYTAGLSIIDASKPNILVETGYFDTSPNFNGGTFNGNWGAYPFLPSGLILATDMEEGLFVLRPNYKRASFLEMLVRDCDGNAISGAKIFLDNDSVAVSNLAGRVAFGALLDGRYDLRIEAAGYYSELIQDLELRPGLTANLTPTLRDSSSRFKLVFADDQQNPIPSVSYSLRGENGIFNGVAAQNGQADINDLPFGDYELYLGKWGYKNVCIDQTTYSCATDTDLYLLEEGAEDNFELDLGWTVSGNETDGRWSRVKPLGVFDGTELSNPGVDALDRCGGRAFITGNGLGNADRFDVDSLTVLSSPSFDLSGYIDPYLVFYTWFYNGGTQANDRIQVSLIDTAGQSTTALSIRATNTMMSNWVIQDLRVSRYLDPLALDRIEIRVEDRSVSNILEAGLDGFFVSEGSFIGLEELDEEKAFLVYPNPVGELLNVQLRTDQFLSAELYDISGRKLVVAPLKQGTQHFDLSPFPSGIYVLRMIRKDGVIEQSKVIKQ